MGSPASRAALVAGATGATDVTGAGLLGQLGRMALAVGRRRELRVDDIPLIMGARAFASRGWS